MKTFTEDKISNNIRKLQAIDDIINDNYFEVEPGTLIDRYAIKKCLYDFIQEELVCEASIDYMCNFLKKGEFINLQDIICNAVDKIDMEDFEKYIEENDLPF